MVHSGIFATLLQIQYKCGANANATAQAEAFINSYCAEAESYINVRTGNNWSDDYAALDADVKALLQECESCLVAMSVISYDMSGFTSRMEAQTMLDYLNNRVNFCLKELEDKNKQKFMDDV